MAAVTLRAPGSSTAPIEPVWTWPVAGRRATVGTSQCRSNSYVAAPESSSVATAVEVGSSPQLSGRTVTP